MNNFEKIKAMNIDEMINFINRLRTSYCQYKEHKIKNIALKALNLVDYKTYFKRNNVSVKQEGFKALQQIVDFIESEDKNGSN